jgi:glutathione S-transferase
LNLTRAPLGIPIDSVKADRALGLADITVACAFGFTHALLADVVETSRYPNLGAFCARAEALPPFRAAPPEDGATASVIGD